MQKIITLISVFTILTLSLKSQTSGPTQPDFMKFSQIETGKNVNEFDGSFNYSIPVLSIPSGNKVGYSLQLTYQSGLGPNDEATWVGFGWSLNPGSIVRQVKGFPDDFDGVDVTFINSSRPNITLTDIITLHPEFFSKDVPNLKASLTRNVNNYSGYTYTTGLGASSHGIQLNSSFDNTGEYSISAAVSPKNLFAALGKIDENVATFVNDNYIYLNSSFGLLNGLWNTEYGKGIQPMNLSAYSGKSVSSVPLFKYEQATLWGLESNLFFSYMYSQNQIINPIEKVSTYGFMYSGKGYNDKNSLMDYYNEKEVGLSMRSNNLPIPFNNADNFIVSGNGVGGNFKLHSKKTGLFRPRTMRSSQEIQNVFNGTLGVNFTPLQLILGWDPSYGYQETILSDWDDFVSANNNLKYDAFVNRNETTEQSKLSIAENYFFKFHNDLTYSESPYIKQEGSKFNVSIEKIFSPLTLSFPDFLQFSQDVNMTYYKNNISEYNPDNRVERSEYIDYNLFENDITNISEISEGLSTGGSYNLNSNANYDSFGYNYNDTSVPITDKKSKLKEFKITNKDGANYIYGLPVKNFNEVNASYNLTNIDNQIGSLPYTLDGKIVKNTGFTLKDLNSSVYGNSRIQNEPYAGTFLLTNIYSADYVDLTMDGPTLDDIGDFVLFNYRRVDTIKWREPYVGLNYNKNMNSDMQDDQGTVNYGTKELYYLESIETKTHIAIFVTNKFDASTADIKYRYKIAKSSETSEIPIELKGSLSNRLDAYPAINDEKIANSDNFTSATNLDNKLEFLEKIVLFSKDLSRNNDIETNLVTNKDKKVIYLDNKIQVTNLRYDETYPIWKGMPNSKDGKGKLTLKSIWTDKEDVKEEKVAMYQFNYLYPTGTSYDVTKDIKDFHNNFAVNAQEPHYSKMNIDRWGNYTYLNNVNDPLNPLLDNSIYNLGIPGFPLTTFPLSKNIYVNTFLPFGINKVNQLSTRYGGVNNKKEYFDPAAWNLKHIILPNSGETEINYEKNEYSYVQAENATILFQIDEFDDTHVKPNSFPIPDTKLHKIFINPSKTIQLNQVYLNKYINFLKDKVLYKEIYYKYYYKLNEDILTNDNFDCNHEYVDGYYKISGIEKNGSDNRIIFTVEELIPLTKCNEFYEKRKNGLTNGDFCEPCQNKIEHEILSNKDITESSFRNTKGVFDQNPSCKHLSPEYSFIKLPIMDITPKFGGGIRVKRVINYDNFDSKAEGSIGYKKFYGNEYLYGEYLDINTFTDPLNPNFTEKLFVSSGVATTEPYLGNEENALKNKIQLFDDEELNKFRLTSLVSAKFDHKKPNREEYEGPFCEGVLPSQKVNYSKVIIKSINLDFDDLSIMNESINNFNKNFNNNDIIVKEYNTVKDFPYNMNYIFKDIQKNTEYKINGSKWTKIAKQDYFPIDFSIGYSDTFGENGQNGWGVGLNIVNNDFNFAQSYQFIINTMHGQPKSVSSYSAYDITDNTTWKLNSSTEYEYFPLGEPLPIINNIKMLTANSIKDINYDWLGTFIEFNNESRDLRTEYRQPFLDTDINLPLWSFFPPIKASASFRYTEKIEDFRYFTSNKIITLPSFVKKVKNYTNGIYSEVENVAFDPLTGEVAIKRISDNYDNIASTGGELFPKSFYYEFGLNNTLNRNRDKMLSDINKAQLTSYYGSSIFDNQSNKYNFKLLTTSQNSEFFLQMIPNIRKPVNYSACELFEKLNKGDIIKLSKNEFIPATDEPEYDSQGTQIGIKHIPDQLINHKDFFVILENQCDVLYLKKLNSQLIDNSLVTNFVDFELVRSGNTNQLTNKIASFVGYGYGTLQNTSFPQKVLTEINIDSDPNNKDFAHSNYYNPNSNAKWKTSIELRNLLNELINTFNYPNTITSTGYLPYEEISSSWNLFTIPTNYNNLSVKSKNGECVSLLDKVTISYMITDFFNLTGSCSGSDNSLANYTKFYTTSTETTSGFDYNVTYKLYHLLFKIEFNDAGLVRSQIFNSYISDFIQAEKLNSISIEIITDPTTIGLKHRELPEYFLDFDNELKFRRNTYSDIDGFKFVYPPLATKNDDCEIYIKEIMKSTHYNRSWCDKVAILNPCEYCRTDYVNVDQKVISTNVNEFKEFNLNSQKEFRYLNNINVSDFNSPTTFVPTPNNTTGLPSGNDLKPNIEAKNDIINLKVLPSGSKLQLTNTYFYENTNPNNKVSITDNIVNTDEQTLANSNNLYLGQKSIINSGEMSNTFTLYNWSNDERNNQWIKSNNITYNNQMVPFIQSNAYGIQSGVGYDNYLNQIPIFTINRYNPKIAIVEDMENYNYLFLGRYNTNNDRYYKLMETPLYSLSNGYSHTGRYSFILNPNETFTSTNLIDVNYLTNASANEKTLPLYKLSFWVKLKDNYVFNSKSEFETSLLSIPSIEPISFSLNHIKQLIAPIYLPIFNIKSKFKLQIGEWYLFEGKSSTPITIPALSSGKFGYLKLSIARGLNCPTDDILIDDIRFAPIDAEVNSYVYDWKESYKMSAVLDNENIPIKFVYDDKGDLKSKVASTINGERTLNESYYNIPKVMRPLEDSYTTQSNNTNVPSNSIINKKIESGFKNNNIKDKTKEILNKTVSSQKDKVDKSKINNDKIDEINKNILKNERSKTNNFKDELKSKYNVNSINPYRDIDTSNGYKLDEKINQDDIKNYFKKDTTKKR